MKKYIIALVFLIVAGLGLKFLRTPIDPGTSSVGQNSYIPSVDGKNQKLADLEKSVASQPTPGFSINRNGPDLVITTRSGKAFSYKDTKNETASNFSYVVEYRSNPEVLVVYSESAEIRKFAYLLASGNEIPANHYLYPSPSGTRAVQVSSPDPKSEQPSKYSFIGWSIVEKDGDTFKEISKQTPIEFKDFNNVGLRFSSWDGEEAIDVIIKYTTTQKAEFVTLCVPGKIELIDDKWTLNAELEAAEQDCNEFNTLMAPEPIKEIL
tara:strand:+ start:39243 stop:40040 length:798 start_codon:yes stop_codon:yes gene_type:complete